MGRQCRGDRMLPSPCPSRQGGDDHLWQVTSTCFAGDWGHEETTAVWLCAHWLPWSGSWSGVQTMWFLQSAWVQRGVLLHAVLMSTLPAHSVVLLPSEEDGWTCPTTSIYQGHWKGTSPSMTTETPRALCPQSNPGSPKTRLLLNQWGEINTLGSGESFHQSQMPIAEKSFSSYAFSLLVGCRQMPVDCFRAGRNFWKDKFRRSQFPPENISLHSCCLVLIF